MEIIKISNLSKEYKIDANAGYKSIRENLLSNPFKGSNKETFNALENINLSINKGESLGIIGKNGAGKSTLLKILSKITFPSQGEIEVTGKVASLLEVGTGFHPELTGRENIYFNGSILGLTRKEIDLNIESIIEFSGIERFIETPLKKYSSGMRLRLAFAVASHLTAEVLVIDEVLAVGDAEFQKKCINKMDEVAHSGRTIVFVSHDLSAVKKLCARSVVLDKGKIVFDGPTDEAISTYLNIMEVASVVSYDLTTIDRRSTSDFQFSKVVLNKSEYYSGDDFKIALDLENTSGFPQTSLIFGIDIFNIYGTCVLHLSNVFLGESNVQFEEGKTYKFKVPDLRLSPGKYSFDLYIGAQGQNKDHLKNVGQFNIAHSNPYGYVGDIPILGAYHPDFEFE